ncbi:hypothetical protein EFE42_02990 [Methanohalophilus sp. RSK]|uniref:DUF5518 domain-containing protein n=1 Tax=Methanohalophilus sp. RSK TaxID=2485783 RepID=UPI000F43B837|nr:DUF5518 domain-containing protein [Methanohalophilus sp. RSK]RNI14367.1 hypothetical protein EFE42_02990 [Methanohalophilus sp. RSK]
MGLIKGAVIGLIVTFVLYLVPVVNMFSPFVGGFAGAYSEVRSAWDGFLVGLFMFILMVIPGFILAGFVGSLFHNSLMAIVTGIGAGVFVLIMLHTGIIGIIGAVLGGLLAHD